ncbi:MAG TPA: hypothetical protein VGI10_24100 [Polyangiaceae bacterium]
MARRHLICASYALLAFACGASSMRATSGGDASYPSVQSSQASSPGAGVPSAAAAEEPQSAPASVPPKDSAHQLAIEAVACWSGGLWSDAEGADDDTGAENARLRCQELVQMVYGSNDLIRYERVRALEPVEVSELKDRIVAAARSEAAPAANVAALGLFVDRVASAEREAMLARRAADRVKKDVEGERYPGKLTADEPESVDPLRDARAFEALYSGDFGDLGHEARTIALLCALDRMQISYGLTKHLKVYTVERPFTLLFGLAPPVVPDDAHKSLKGGAWLSYLTRAASAAGHPVPKTARLLEDQERLARAGVLAGLADKLRPELAEIPSTSELKRVGDAIVNRLDMEYRVAEASVR